uniref:Desmoplakin n=1 Tax=Sinocyclocheilus grahami TaxID=75366 RepID=A0A672L451_SINGR
MLVYAGPFAGLCWSFCWFMLVMCWQRTSLNQQRTILNQQRASINQQRTSLNQQRASINQQRASINQQRTSLNQQKTILNQHPSVKTYLTSICWFFQQSCSCLNHNSNSPENKTYLMSFYLQSIIEEISRAIMWVNDREEEELVFDWGDKNIDTYIPQKQESYSKLMSDLEEKEKELNKLKAKVDNLLRTQHPASDKIQAYMDTLQTQWSWLLQITKCIHVHLKENAAYSQFFKEANETYSRLQKDHESIRKKFTCDKNTPLENLTEMLKNLEKEKDRIMESKRQVQTLVNKSKSIVCLKPRNPEEKSSGPVIVKALCDFKQDQKGILKGDEGILKDNSQRSKWHVTGPGGLEMLIPSVCLFIPPPNPLSIGLAHKNEQYYEAIMSIWSQLYINIKSLISWQYCMKDVQYINSLTLSMLSQMRPEEYRNIIKNLELHYQEFMRNCLGSEMFSDEEKRKMEMQYAGAQSHYDRLVIQLPNYSKTRAHRIQSHHIIISTHECSVTSHLAVISSQCFHGDLFVCVSRLSALQALLQHLLQAEDIVKVHEARLTEKETTSLDLNEVEKYHMTLKTMKAELEQKKGVLKAMETELSKAVHWNSQIDKSFHQCDVDLSRYSELVGQMTDRWRRIVTQIDSRVWDLEKQEKQLNHYKQTNSMINKWIQETRQRQDALQITKFNSLDSLMDQLNQQKALYSEIKGKKEKVDDVAKDADTCAASIKDYELQLASYSAGLETLLNIPIKRTMLQSPSTELRQEAADLQSHYIELLTRSSDYYKFLGEMMKNMEELKVKMRNTKIDLLEEELKRLKDNLKDQTHKNQSMEDSLARYRLELTQSKEELISMEEIKRTQARQCSTTRESLDSTQNQLKNLQDEVSRLTFLIEEEKRKRRLAEDRYTTQQEEYELAVRKRQKELEELSLSKSQFERAIKEKEREIERLQLQLQDEASRRNAAELETSKVRTQLNQDINSLKHTFESEIHITKTSVLKATQQKEEESTTLRFQLDRLNSEKRDLEEELRKLQLSFSQAEAARRKSEEDAHQQRSTEGSRFKKELESQIQVILRQKEETETRHRVELTEANRAEQESASGRRHDQELRSLKDELERSQKDYKITVENLNRVNGELKALQQQLLREQGLVREANQRNDSLYKTLEDKSRLLNESTSEIEKLQSLTQNLTKEHLRLEEELRTVRLERDDVKRSLSTIESESASRLSAIQFQLQTSNNRALELQELINDLTKERENLRVEIAQIQKQFTETSMMIQRSDATYKNIVQERDSLLVKMKLLQQDKDKQQRSEDELRRIKLSLESEIKQKQRLQDEIDKITKDFKYWKSQYELKEGQIRQSEADKDKVQRDRTSLQSEIQRLTAELRSLEERYKSRLQSSDKEISEITMKKESLERELRIQKLTVKGLRGEVSLTELVDSNLLDQTDLDKVNRGQLTGKEIEDRLRSYLGGSDCIAGIYDEANGRVLPFYQAMKEGLLRRGTTLELLEAQASSGFIIDPVNNVCMTVEEAWRRALVGKEFKDKLLSAEKAVTGYKDPATGKIISLFQAIEKEIIEKGHGIRLLEAQIASGGIIDPKGSHRIDVEVAYRKGYFDREMNDILTYEGDDTKGFFDPNTHENLTYLQLKKRCIKDPKTGLILLPLKDKKTPKHTTSQKNTLRKRRVVIVDPDTGKEMTVREAYHRELIDYDTFLELSEQECEWEEITIETSDGSNRLLIVDRKTGTQYDIQESIDRGVIDRQTLDKYRAGTLTIHEFAGLITSKSSNSELSICTSSPEDVASCSNPTQMAPSSPTVRKRFSSVSITFSPPSDIFDDQSPVGAIFDTETLEKITIPAAQRRGIVDNITAQRLLEAQVCTGGVVNPATGQRLALKDAVQQSLIDEDMSIKLKPAQKAYAGFEDVKTKRKLSAAEAIKEKWLPYEAGQRFLEFQYLTGGLVEPETGHRVSIEEAIRRGWLDGKGAQKLQDTRNYIKNLTCPKTKLKISYKEAMDNCMVEENNGMKMLQATSMSTKGISSPYNVSSGSNSRTGSRAGSRTGSRSGSRRGSVDYTSSVSYILTFIKNISLDLRL